MARALSITDSFAIRDIAPIKKWAFAHLSYSSPVAIIHRAGRIGTLDPVAHSRVGMSVVIGAMIVATATMVRRNTKAGILDFIAAGSHTPRTQEGVAIRIHRAGGIRLSTGQLVAVDGAGGENTLEPAG